MAASTSNVSELHSMYEPDSQHSIQMGHHSNNASLPHNATNTNLQLNNNSSMLHDESSKQ